MVTLKQAPVGYTNRIAFGWKLQAQRFVMVRNFTNFSNTPTAVLINIHIFLLIVGQMTLRNGIGVRPQLHRAF